MQIKINGKYVCVPNFFEKEHFEEILDKKLNKRQFVILSEQIQEDLMDTISNLVWDYLVENKQNIDVMLNEEK